MAEGEVTERFYALDENDVNFRQYHLRDLKIDLEAISFSNRTTRIVGSEVYSEQFIASEGDVRGVPVDSHVYIMRSGKESIKVRSWYGRDRFDDEVPEPEHVLIHVVGERQLLDSVDELVARYCSDHTK